MAELAYGYARIEKSEKLDDGTLMVYGKATDDSLDIDKQICDNEWLKNAMPDWMVSGGNIREQHSSIAAGVATEYEAKNDGHYVRALVVDPGSVKKVELGVLKGFSIGIRNPRVVRDNKAAGGRIVDGQIVEISLVDRPANPNAKLMLAKADSVGLLTKIAPVDVPKPSMLNKFNESHDETGRFASGDGGANAAQTAHDNIQTGLNQLKDDHARLSAGAGLTDKTLPTRIGENLQTAQVALDRANEARQAGDHATANGAVREATQFASRADQSLNALNASFSAATGSTPFRGDSISRGMREQADLHESLVGGSGKSIDADVAKFNENHDEQGRFTSSDGGPADFSNHIGTSDAVWQTGNTLGAAGNSQAASHLRIAGHFMEEAAKADNKGLQVSHLIDANHHALMAQSYAETTGHGDLTRPITSAIVQSFKDNYNAKSVVADDRVESMELNKFNENHDETGRFSAGDGGGRENPGKTAQVGDRVTVDSKSWHMTADQSQLKPVGQTTGTVVHNSLTEALGVKIDDPGHSAHGMTLGIDRNAITSATPASKAADADLEKGDNLEDKKDKPEPGDDSTETESPEEDATETDESDDELEKAADCACGCDKCATKSGCEADLCKCNKSTDADVQKAIAVSFNDEDLNDVIEKAVANAKASVTEELDKLRSAYEAEVAKSVQLTDELATAKKAVAGGGPSRSTAAKPQTEINALLTEAAEYRYKASMVNDPVLAKGYRQLADDAELKASRKDVK